MSIKKHGARGINKQRYMCKNKKCKKSFTIETAESEALKRKLTNDRLKRNLGLLTCPKCGSKV
jgi:transposase-like protein